jgi:hypothetical protein
MQLIDIDKIIWELQKTDEWYDYKVQMFNRIWNKNTNIIRKYFSWWIEEVKNYNPRKSRYKNDKIDFLHYYKNYEKQLNFLIWKEWFLNAWNISVLNLKNSEFSWWHFEKLKKKFMDLIFKEIYYCPFCGRTPFMENWNLKNFDLDHFFPKNLTVNWKTPFKYLTYNFYNLVPICWFCNQKIKKVKNPLSYLNKWAEIFYPYFWWLYLNGFNIKIKKDEWKTLSFNQKYSFYKQSFLDPHSAFFQLQDFYIKKRDVANDVLFINKSKAKILATKQLKINNWATNEELKKYFFKNYAPQSENEILKFSNGKFKKDLIDNLKLPNN